MDVDNHSHPSDSPTTIQFWGHACFGIHLHGTPWLLIDPFDSNGLGGTPGPPPISVRYPFVMATHEHADHAAFWQHSHATVLHPPHRFPDSQTIFINAITVAHDEFGGRLRGGTTRMLDIRIGDLRIVHAGDIGERLVGDSLRWLQSPPPDVLILPAGGYYTLGADGAANLAALVRPRFVIFCHTYDDGLPLAHLAPRDVIRRRTSKWPQQECDVLVLPHVQPDPDENKAPTVVWLRRHS